MIIYRAPSAYLSNYAQIVQHYQVMQKYKREDIAREHYAEYAKLLAAQEAARLLRNYNYMKETEFLNQYAFAESIKEQRLINRAGSVGLYIDRYI